MEIMKRLTVIKQRIEKRLKGKTFNIIKIQFYIAFLTFIFIFEN